MAGATVLHVHPGTAIGEQIQTTLAAVPELDVAQCETVDDAEVQLRERDVDCLVGGCDLRECSASELVAVARAASPDVGCVLYGSERPAIDPVDPTEGIVEFVPVESRAAVDRVVDLAVVTGRDRTQTSYPLHSQENDRLECVDQYDLDDDQARELQTIVDRAASRLGASQATINVIGEEDQEFGVCHDEDWATIPRQDSICTYTILSEGPTVVSDVGDDPRFEANDVLSEKEIRSYGAAPIEPEAGLPIATLCVYDEQPGQFDDADARYLDSLARDAAAVIARTGDEEAIER